MKLPFTNDFLKVWAPYLEDGK